jgi:hypothetical protein
VLTQQKLSSLQLSSAPAITTLPRPAAQRAWRRRPDRQFEDDGMFTSVSSVRAGTHTPTHGARVR